ncbi:hypothetical protein PG993_013742 [Apiospora rasikravindrae]|uniref:F-box domain-containing protein n=1 Tax=Apiospora rasikravindrae TaxID=990691 RepID=A0ABR1RR18_9PEZI
MASFGRTMSRISRLEGLPDELILDIIRRLSFDSFYCVSQCSRRLRAICKDRSCRRFREIQKELGQDKVNTHEWQVRMQSKHQKDTMRFSPKMLTVALRVPTLWRLLPLLRKDVFCGECLEFRQQPQFVRNARWLLKKEHYCSGCGDYHGAVLFPPDPLTWAPGEYCLAHSGSVRLCPHQQRTWAEIGRVQPALLWESGLMTPNRQFFHCTECDEVASNSCGAAIYYDLDAAHLQYGRLLPDSPDLRQGKSLGEEYLSAVQTFGKTAEYQYICPHLRLDDPHLLFRLARAIPDFWSRHSSGGPNLFHTDPNLSEASGYVFQCRSCRCLMELDLVREKSTNPGKLGKVRLALRTRQRMILADSPGAEYLLKLDPASYGVVDVRGPRSRCISWCESSGCATNRLGRREARVLEAAW